MIQLQSQFLTYKYGQLLSAASAYCTCSRHDHASNKDNSNTLLLNSNKLIKRPQIRNKLFAHVVNQFIAYSCYIEGNFFYSTRTFIIYMLKQIAK